MVPFRLRIPRPILEVLLDHARTERPYECCGLLAGTVADGWGDVRTRYPLVNELRSRTEFLSEPRSLFDAMKAMRQNGEEILAVYHSHPSSAPIPSLRDRERNYSEQVMTVIVGFEKDECSLRVWWLTAETASEAEWLVEE